MPKIVAYLNFNGNCREAMEFYRDCLGGTLELQQVGDSPKGKHLPETMKDRILHASLKKGNMVLMGTDLVPDNGIGKGNSISILLTSPNKEEIVAYHTNLKENGRVTHALDTTGEGLLFGGLTDKYGNHWLFFCTQGEVVHPPGGA
ncbi:MAG: VOC family protein [Sediminicola sp.]